MKSVRYFLLMLIIPFAFSWPTAAFYGSSGNRSNDEISSSDRLLNRYQFFPERQLLSLLSSTDLLEDRNAMMLINIVPRPVDGGIREEIPVKYRERFDKWKAEFRSTEIGRTQWDTYANNKNFVLTIKVTGNRGKGAGTDKFLWDDQGHFVGATITLGGELDDGFPDPIYYPVLNSLSTEEGLSQIDGTIVAATKISHEIGHVNQAAQADMRFLQLQNDLMPVYNSIFLKNGLDVHDKKLQELAVQMGGTPTEIWESREYWSEVNAMLYLGERISKENFYCHVFNKIRRNIEDHARAYKQRFGQYPMYTASPCWK